MARPLCFLAALVVIEGHLLVGQSVAWFTMIHERTPVLGLQQSIANTFSGAHPCDICTALQNESRKQKEDAPTPEAGPLVKVIAVLFNGKRIAVFPPPQLWHVRPTRRTCPFQHHPPCSRRRDRRQDFVTTVTSPASGSPQTHPELPANGSRAW
ncbi:MAG: hypothetical protein VCA40_12575 [Roseibacillus sp.]|nr:hypothetical protein [Roseibacillus sp.]